jgi:predicted TIM-barrel fold metal-dependent hydrolase
MIMRRRTFLTSASAAAAMAGLAKSASGATPEGLKLFDTHAHFYSSDLEKYPLRPDVTPAAMAKAKAHPMTPEVILAQWDANGVELGCGVQYNTTYATDDRYLLDIAAQHPARIRPVVILNPVDSETPNALAQMAKENSICGVRFSGVPDSAGTFAFLTDAAKGAWQAANDLGLVIVLMPTTANLPSAMRRIGELADGYPNVRIVIDHIGFPDVQVSETFGFSPEHLALSAHKNVNYKYTTLLIERLRAANVPATDFLQFVVGHYGAEHLVWGSDIGNTEGDFATFVKLALESAAGLKPAQRKAIFSDTARGLFIPGGRGAARA